MELLSEWRRWRIYTFYKHWRKIVKKEAIDESKKGAINKEIQILKKLYKENVDFVPIIENSWDWWFEYEYICWVTFDKYDWWKYSLNILIDFLDKIKRLDDLKINHWELNRPTKNVLINNNEVYILDFERWRYVIEEWKNMRGFAQWLLRNWFLSKKFVINLWKINSWEEMYLLIKNNLKIWNQHI